MIDHLIKFFKGRHNEKLPILLAFSGGPDSLALLHLLIEFRNSCSLKLALAHVDHGWREESAAESLEILQMAEKLGLPLHLHKLDPKDLRGNMEAACREERYRFFASLCQQYGYQAVLLAHHADDVAETVLKRTLEGASLPYLAAIRPEAVINSVKVWRPLLSVSKKNILEWLQERALKGFADRTNEDTKFLRARLRIEVIPHLSQMFGKEVSSGLSQIGEEAGELRDYLDARIRPYLDEIVKGEWGNYLDLSQNCPASLFELKYLVRQFSKPTLFALSRECVNQAAEFILQKKANKYFITGRKESSSKIFFDRGRLFIPSVEFPLLSDTPVKIEELKSVRLGVWEAEATPWNVSSRVPPTDWKSVWKFGSGEVILPKGHYELASPDQSINKWWSDHKIPAFFRAKVPVILENGCVIHEFLTGQNYLSKSLKSDGYLRIRLNYIFNHTRMKVSG